MRRTVRTALRAWLVLAAVDAAPKLSSKRNCGLRCELVIAHCDEDLGWLVGEVPKYRRAFLYTKCGTRIQDEVAHALVDKLEIIPSPNVGSNDYAVLQHLVRHYYDLAPLTVFCEAGLHKLCHADTVARPTLASATATMPYEALPEFSAPAGLECLRAKDPHAACRLRDIDSRYVYTDRVDGVGGWSAPREWTSKTGGYRFQHTSGRRFDYVLSGFDNLSAWLSHTAGTELAQHVLAGGQRLVLGGFFAAEAANLRRYPRSLYLAMARQQLHPNEEV